MFIKDLTIIMRMVIPRCHVQNTFRKFEEVFSFLGRCTILEVSLKITWRNYKAKISFEETLKFFKAFSSNIFLKFIQIIFKVFVPGYI